MRYCYSSICCCCNATLLLACLVSIIDHIEGLHVSGVPCALLIHGAHLFEPLKALEFAWGVNLCVSLLEEKQNLLNSGRNGQYE